jgi:hypothetical protein
LQENLRENILKLQLEDEWYKEVKSNLENEFMQIPMFEGYTLDENGLLRFYGRIYILPNEELCNFSLRETHRATYMAHSRVKKMNADLKPLFFLRGMKRDIVDFVVRCLECQ